MVPLSVPVFSQATSNEESFVKNIAEAREKVFQLFGSEGVQAFDEVIRDKQGTITVEDRRVTFRDASGALRFRAGEELPGENE